MFFNDPKGARTDQSSYRCEICGKSFRRKFNRDVHRRVHTGEKPYECQSCFKRFGTKSNLKAHMIVHLDVSMDQNLA